MSKWIEQDSAHCLHPFTNFKALNDKGSRIIKRAEGVYIYDEDDNKILAPLPCLALPCLA